MSETPRTDAILPIGSAANPNVQHVAIELAGLARQLERELAQAQARCAELEKALERSRVAIDDWINTYASEMCDEKRVKEAYDRIRDAGGTLAYIAKVQQVNRAVLKETR